jgi:AbrB family looped-hinge helix DNA binding protein
MDDLYVSKITAAGQVSIPKEVRGNMGLEEGYVSIEPHKDRIIMRKIRSFKEDLAYFRKEAKRREIARADVQKAIDEVRPELMKEMYGIE